MESEIKLEIYKLEKCPHKDFDSTLENIKSSLNEITTGLDNVLQNLKASEPCSQYVFECVDGAVKELKPCLANLLNINFHAPTKEKIVDYAKSAAKNYEGYLGNLINYIAHGDIAQPTKPAEGDLGKILEKDMGCIEQKKAACANDIYTYAALEIWETNAKEFNALLPLFKILAKKEKHFAEGLVGAYLERRTKSAKLIEKAVKKNYALGCVGDQIFQLLLKELEAHEHECKDDELKWQYLGLHNSLEAKKNMHKHPPSICPVGPGLANLEACLEKLESDAGSFYMKITEKVCELDKPGLPPYEINHQLAPLGDELSAILAPVKDSITRLVSLCITPELQQLALQAKGSSDKLCQNWKQKYEGDVSRVDERPGSAINILSREQGEVETEIYEIKSVAKKIRQKLTTAILKELEVKDGA